MDKRMLREIYAGIKISSWAKGKIKQSLGKSSTQKELQEWARVGGMGTLTYSGESHSRKQLGIAQKAKDVHTLQPHSSTPRCMPSLGGTLSCTHAQRNRYNNVPCTRHPGDSKKLERTSMSTHRLINI